MSKRRADSQLTHENWNQEDAAETDEVSSDFRQASTEELSRRRICVAKRRALHSAADSTSTRNVFASFTGLCPKPSSSPALKQNVEPPNSQTSTNAFWSKSWGSTFSAKSVTEENQEKSSSVDDEYCRSLKSLNGSFLSWIKHNFDVNPYVDFSPVFSDYQSHLAKLEERKKAYAPSNSFGDHNAKTSKINFSFSAKLQDSPNDRSASPSSVVTTTTDLICSTKQQSDENEAKPLNELDSETKASDDGRDSKLKIDAAGDIKETCTTTDSNQDDNRAADVNVKPQFQFKFDFPKSETFQISAPEATKPSDTNVSAAVEPTFSFGASLGSSSTSFAATMNSEVTTSAEDDEAAYVPPAVQLQPITEEGSTYSVKCKLFFKLPDKEYQERGIGYLFLKPTDDAKTQLIVRADNTLGNILLNILLTAATRHSRVGKNNVSLAAVPNPPLEGSQNPSDPVVFLIRVRTAEDADQLFEQISNATMTEA